jgi:hypothetical protein
MASSTSAIAARRPLAPAAARPGRRFLGSAPGGLLLGCAVVAIVVALPVGVTVVQGLQGGLGSVLPAVDASSPRTLLLHWVLVAAEGIAPIWASRGSVVSWRGLKDDSFELGQRLAAETQCGLKALQAELAGV